MKILAYACELMMNMIDDDLLLWNNNVFSDEASFELTSNVRHNYRYWRDTNHSPEKN